MKKIMNLNQFQKLLLIVIMGSVLFTGLIYCTLNSKIGFEYQKQIFIPESQNDCTVYSGILNGKQDLLYLIIKLFLNMVMIK